MRILDDESDKKLDSITIFLTTKEVEQFRSYLSQLLENPKPQHTHLSSEDYQKEITLCLYDEENLQGLHPRAIKLIKKDE